MEIRLERAMTRGDSGYKPCEWCGEDFEPRPVMVTVSPHGFEICPDCIRVALVGERCGVRAQWPTWERYQEALSLYPEFMMTAEECERSEELGLYDDFFDLTIIEV